MAEALPQTELAGLIPAAARAVLPSAVVDVVPLEGGRGINQCLRIDGADGSASVLRLRRGPALAGADPRRELASQRIAAAAGLAPRVLAADAAAGWTLMAHVPALPWTVDRLKQSDDLWRLCARLRSLHGLVKPPVAPIDGLALLRTHCEVLAPHAPAEARERLEEGGEIAARLGELPRRRTALCHGDPDVSNFLGEGPMLIDFEYAQVADPTYDIALLIGYYPFLEPQQDTLLAAAGLGDPLSQRRLPLQVALCRVVDAAWARVQTLLTALD
ncbi:MAG: phosphotransferase [Steroidobacteraceae bacterium]